MLKLLDPHSSRYLGPIEAIRESFADSARIRRRWSAAIQAAIDELMNRIEPGELQERFDRGLKRGALLGATNKMKYWDLYTEFYQVLNQRNEQGLPTLFAEELARTYAEKSQEAPEEEADGAMANLSAASACASSRSAPHLLRAAPADPIRRDPIQNVDVAADVLHEAHRLPAARIAALHARVPLRLRQQRQVFAHVAPRVRILAVHLRQDARVLQMARRRRCTRRA